MTRTIYTLEDVGGALSWASLSSFVKNLGSDSALARSLEKSTGWEQTIKTNEILADIYDLLNKMNTNICAMTGSKHKKIIPYPRPGRDENNTKKIGKGAVPLSDLRKWLRRKQNGGKD